MKTLLLKLYGVKGLIDLLRDLAFNLLDRSVNINVNLNSFLKILISFFAGIFSVITDDDKDNTKQILGVVEIYAKEIIVKLFRFIPLNIQKEIIEILKLIIQENETSTTTNEPS